MQTFAEYKAKAEAFGSMLKGRDEWFVSDISRHRESKIIDESNFDAALKVLKGESETLEIVRFGHWAVGWIEHLFIHPSRKTELESLEEKLDNYPILDEDDFRGREDAATFEAWVSYGCKEFAELLQERFDLMDSTRDLILRSPDWTEFVFSEKMSNVLRREDEKHIVNVDQITRNELAAVLVELRNKIRSNT